MHTDSTVVITDCNQSHILSHTWKLCPNIKISYLKLFDGCCLETKILQVHGCRRHVGDHDYRLMIKEGHGPTKQLTGVYKMHVQRQLLCPTFIIGLPYDGATTGLLQLPGYATCIWVSIVTRAAPCNAQLHCIRVCICGEPAILTSLTDCHVTTPQAPQTIASALSTRALQSTYPVRSMQTWFHCSANHTQHERFSQHVYIIYTFENQFGRGGGHCKGNICTF